MTGPFLFMLVAGGAGVGTAGGEGDRDAAGVPTWEESGQAVPPFADLPRGEWLVFYQDDKGAGEDFRFQIGDFKMKTFLNRPKRFGWRKPEPKSRKTERAGTPWGRANPEAARKSESPSKRRSTVMR